MQDPGYYRREAEHARRLLKLVHQAELVEMLTGVIREYDDLAEDLESGAVEIRHPESLPQRESSG
jgi:hypothetical protein